MPKLYARVYVPSLARWVQVDETVARYVVEVMLQFPELLSEWAIMFE